MGFWSSIFRSESLSEEVQDIEAALKALIEFANEADARIESGCGFNPNDRDTANRLKRNLFELLCRCRPEGWSLAKVRRRIINPTLDESAVTIGARIAVNRVLEDAEKFASR